MPAGLVLTNGLFRIPGEVTCDKRGDREIETKVQRAAEPFASGGDGAGAE
jgi:hypothetical protein